jgi:dienelactone hydrolase
MNRRTLYAGFLLGLCAQMHTGCTTRPASASRPVRQTDSFTIQGREIKVETFLPKASGRFPTVLVLHGSSGTLVGKGPLVKLCQQLSAQGQVAILVHYFDRTGTVWSGDKSIHQHWPVWVETIRAAVDYASAHPSVHPDSIGLFGFSLGAYLAVAEAADDTRVKAVAELAGGLFDRQKPTITHLPRLLILHGRDDKRVLVTQALELAATARRLGTPHTLKLYDQEGHVLSGKAITDAMSRTLLFFNQHLPLAPQTRSSLTKHTTTKPNY